MAKHLAVLNSKAVKNMKENPDFNNICISYEKVYYEISMLNKRTKLTEDEVSKLRTIKHKKLELRKEIEEKIEEYKKDPTNWVANNYPVEIKN